jgi:hypothetical protein
LTKLEDRILSFLADLNGSEWIEGDSAGATDMRQRAKSLHQILSDVKYRPDSAIAQEAAK